MGQFPALVDSEGCQAQRQSQPERHADENLGSAWRDRAKAASALAAPRPVAQSKIGVAPRQRHHQNVYGCHEKQPETEYEMRHRVGQRRAKHKVQCGRAGWSRKHGTEGDEDTSSSDESVDGRETMGCI